MVADPPAPVAEVGRPERHRQACQRGAVTAWLPPVFSREGRQVVGFTILGGVGIRHGDRVCAPSEPKVRQVLALLLLRANRLVEMDAVIEELWGDAPPKSSLTTVHTYIYRLRKILARERAAADGKEVLVTQPFGYLLQVEPERIDAVTFARHVADGRELLEAGQPDAAARKLRRSLELWTGPPMANTLQGPLLAAHAQHLEEQHLRALELRVQAEVQLGGERELIGDLRLLVARYPLNEWFHGQLIGALNRAGRRSEALQAYHSIRTLLEEELGLDPSPELERIHREVLGCRNPPSHRHRALPDLRPRTRGPLRGATATHGAGALR